MRVSRQGGNLRGLGSSRALVLCAAVASANAVPASSGTWLELPGLQDLRYEQARDVSGELASGRGRVDLSGTATIRDRTLASLEIGAGWLRPLPAPPASADGGRPGSGPASVADRLDVLSGPGVRIGGPVLLEELGSGLALRWTSLILPGGGEAAVEARLSEDGAWTLQYLRLPESARRAIGEGRLLAGRLAGRATGGLVPGSASAWRLQDARGPRIRPFDPLPEPDADGPPPVGCDPETDSWCARAGGNVSILLNETFDDGMAGGRGWTANGQWGEIDWGTCAPGASANPGRAWYFGSTLGCTYADLSTGDLTSPLIGPITANTVFTFGFRLQLETGFDVAEILINGVPTWNLGNPGDPNAWFTVIELDLSPYAGQMITIGFRFTSDGSVTDLGWFVDDVVVWDPTAGRPNCVLDATVGRGGVADCAQSVADRWSFNERAFCEGCPYTFYVLVECGREMHLPLLDMEGADVQVTDMLTGQPVSLRCRNETSLADAGMGTYRVLWEADCCGTPALEQWWGPAFDQTDSAGPGRVTWGFPDCPNLDVYDTNVDGTLDCFELPGCGGPLDLMTPGESQTMDCFIENAEGLCGLFRVDVTSGGFVWDLFANCDGTSRAQFPIFDDCTDAWAAFNPLPELAVQNLTTANGCPDLQVDFEIVNIGCADYPGDLTVRISSDCLPADVRDEIILGPFPAGMSVPVSLPFTASCTPVRIEVVVDPDDAIAECTESPTAAACNAEAGVDSLATFSCGCTAALTAEAGAAFTACPGEAIVLDGSASGAAPCATPLYRWLDDTGTEVRGWDPNPLASVVFAGCPGGTTYTLEVSCSGEPCTESDTVTVGCIDPVADAGVDQRLCVGAPVVLDGSASMVAGCASPEYRWLDPAGGVLRDWAADPTVSLGDIDCAFDGDYTVEARCRTGGPCSDTDVMTLSCVQVLADLIPDEVFTCEGEEVVFDASSITLTVVNCAEVEYRWRDASTGAVLIDWSPTPDASLTFNDCPAGIALLLEARCAEMGAPPCGSVDGVVVICLEPEAPVPASADLCGGASAALDCGVAEMDVTYWWDLDVLTDSDGDGDPANDRDLDACAGDATWPAAGSYTARAWAGEAVAGCTSFTDLAVEVFDDPAPPQASAQPGCAGAETLLSCGVEDPALSYAWDLDLATDADADGDPENDADASGCELAEPRDAGDHSVRVTATDARGCTASTRVDFTVAPSSPPGEVQNLFVGHAAGTLGFRWDAEPTAGTYRLLRGDIGTWYDHAASDAAGRGACDTLGAQVWADPDDANDGVNRYYLVVAVEPCGAEGSAGTDSFGVERPPRPPTADCP